MNYLQKYQEKLGVSPDGVIGPITAKAMMVDMGIDDPYHFCYLLGQMAVESAHFTAGRENMNYSAQGLANTWARYSSNGRRGGPPTLLARKLAHNPEAIGNNTYAGRNGNGDKDSGDGYKYRGIFGLQLTGKANIIPFILYLGLPDDTDPDSLLGDPRNYFVAGKFWFDKRSLWKYCKGTNSSTILAISRAVNLGRISTTKMPLNWQERQSETQRLFGILKL